MANRVTEIPLELETEILLRLPVKSLLKFRSVCKSWHHLIRSTRFVDTHFNHPSQKSRTDYMIITRNIIPNSVLKFYSRDEDGGLIPATPTNFPVPRHAMLKICGPCNGLICIAAGRIPAFYLCNPATRESCIIPDSPLQVSEKRGKRRGFSLDFYAQGFGFDPRTNQHKIFSVTFSRDVFTYTVEIYEVRLDLWRKVEPAVTDLADLEYYLTDLRYCEWYGIGLFFQGRLHWRIGSSATISFDVSDDVVRDVFRDPYPFYEPAYEPGLFVLDDCMALAQIASPQEGNFIFVWVMTEYGVGESWSKKHSIPLTSDICGVLVPITCWNDDMLILRHHCLHHHRRKHLVTCNLLGNGYQFKVADDKVADDDAYWWVGTVVIRDESLASVHSGKNSTFDPLSLL